MDHMNKICETLDECSETIEVFKDTDYLLSTYRLNRLSRVLTVLGTILLPFLVISSIYGMNIILPGGIEPGSQHFFIILLLIMIIIAGLMLFIFRRKHLI
jgi:magnesium transporter